MYRHVGFGRTWMPGVKNILIANVAIYVVMYLFGFGNIFVEFFGLIPQYVIKGFVWQIFTYMFLHSPDIFHILFNMYALWMFGTALEARWGTREFVKYYMVTGIGAGIISTIMYIRVPTVIIGASGAVYGLLLAFGMMFPTQIVYLFFAFPVQARYLVLIFGVLEFIFGIRGGGGVAHFAHLGGIAVGYVYLKHGWKAEIYWKNFKKNQQRKKFRVVGKDDFTDRDLKEEVDRILDKMNKYGKESLNDLEWKTLKKASKHLKK